MLQYVTITGADDNTDPQDLLGLSEKYPFVEWAILLSWKEGRPRYPRGEWIQGLQAAPPTMNFAMHLCGAAAREFVADPTRIRFLGDYNKPFRRLQVNGYVSGALYLFKGHPETEIILQCRSEDTLRATLDDAASIRERGGSASVLFDPSGGRGLHTLRWPTSPPGAQLGFAGGIGPDNVRHVLQAIGTRESYWIDMETRVRNEQDQLDLAKVEAVLAACAPFAAQNGPA